MKQQGHITAKETTLISGAEMVHPVNKSSNNAHHGEKLNKMSKHPKQVKKSVKAAPKREWSPIKLSEMYHYMQNNSEASIEMKTKAATRIAMTKTNMAIKLAHNELNMHKKWDDFNTRKENLAVAKASQGDRTFKTAIAVAILIISSILIYIGYENSTNELIIGSSIVTIAALIYLNTLSTISLKVIGKETEF